MSNRHAIQDNAVPRTAISASDSSGPCTILTPSGHGYRRSGGRTRQPPINLALASGTVKTGPRTAPGVQRALGSLDGEQDVLVVGGGIHGVWAARSAARRGLSVGLAEAVDFASGTTSRSTMLAHGGLRYLAQYDFGLVREALTERGVLTEKAPHLVQPLTFLLPFYRDSPFPKWQLKMGLRLYSLLALGSGYPSHEFLSKRQVLELEPGLREQGLKGGALYYDGQIFSPERLTTIVARDADRRGVDLANHARVVDLEQADGHVRVGVRDEHTGEEVEARPRAVVNTTGPFLDAFLEEVGLGDDLLRLTKGVHLAVPPFTDHAIVVNAPDGRTFFTLPWYEHQLVGTTDTDYAGDPREVHATRDDVSYLQDATQRYFPAAPVDQVRFTNAGLRNLLKVEGVPPSEVSRDAKVYHHGREGLPGVVSLVGGKLTTARATSRELVDAVADRVHAGEEPADHTPLPGGRFQPRRALSQARLVCRDAGLPDRVATRLVKLYGRDWPRVAGAGLERLDEDAHLLLGEARFAAEQEMAATVEDVVRRRTLGWATSDQAVGVADRVAEVLVETGVPEDPAKASIEGWTSTVELHGRWRD